MLPSKHLLRVTCLAGALVLAFGGWLGGAAAAPVHLTPTFTQESGVDVGGDGPPRVSVTLDHTLLASNGFVNMSSLVDFEVMDGPLRWPHALWAGGISLSGGDITSFDASATLGPGHFDCYGHLADFCRFTFSGTHWSGGPPNNPSAAAIIISMAAVPFESVAVQFVPNFPVFAVLQVPAPAPLASVLLGLVTAALYWRRRRGCVDQGPGREEQDQPPDATR